MHGRPWRHLICRQQTWQSLKGHIRQPSSLACDCGDRACDFIETLDEHRCIVVRVACTLDNLNMPEGSGHAQRTDRQDDRKEYGAAQPKNSSRGPPNQQYRTRGHQEAVNFAASGHSKARNLPLHHIGMSNGLLSRG